MKLISRLRTTLACWLLPAPSSQFIPQPRNTKALADYEHAEHLLKVQVLNQQLETEKLNTAFIQARAMPHRLYTPAISHDGISWVAVAEFADGSKMVGRGECPSQALIDYDLQWLGVKGKVQE
jgi:hypothetical protein